MSGSRYHQTAKSDTAIWWTWWRTRRTMRFDLVRQKTSHCMLQWLANATSAQEVTGSNAHCRHFLIFSSRNIAVICSFGHGMHTNCSVYVNSAFYPLWDDKMAMDECSDYSSLQADSKVTFCSLTYEWAAIWNWPIFIYSSDLSDLMLWRRGLVVTMSVFVWQTFPDLRLIYGWRVTTS